MSIHQRTSHRHKRQLKNMESCRNNRLYYVYITVIILILDLSAIAKCPSKSKYDTYQIHEAMVDSTMYDMLLHKAIPALEKHTDDSFCWMFFSTKSAYARDTTANLVGAVWPIECEDTENIALYYRIPKFFCKIGTKIVFFSDSLPNIKMEENGSTIVLRYLKDNFIRGAYDPDEGKIIRTQNGYKIRFFNGDEE
ncbi:unknown [Prevotella sp. CAG:873]|nr:unknown [Prevotella sp. CAG:873]